jgi:hypothetical protein
MNYWPGTNIPRSRGNAFDWRNYKTGFDVAAFRKQNASPAADTAFGMKGGTIPGMGLMDVKPRPLVHVSKAKSRAESVLAPKPALAKHVSTAKAMKRV